VLVSVTPKSPEDSGVATVSRVSYTPEAAADVECDAPPTKYKLLWEDDFAGTTLGPQWTVYNNCTHGNEAQLYVKEGVSVADGMLKLTAFPFASNRTDRNGVQHRFGSGWVDSASNYSSRALNDCWSNNTQAHPFNFLYGRWEIRAKMPPGHFWTALWLMPDASVCWPKGGEVSETIPATPARRGTRRTTDTHHPARPHRHTPSAGRHPRERHLGAAAAVRTARGVPLGRQGRAVLQGHGGQPRRRRAQVAARF
jgi:hypothetical protein